MTRYDPAMTVAASVAWCEHCGDPYSAHLNRCPECQTAPKGLGLLDREEQDGMFFRYAAQLDLMLGRRQ